MIVETFFTMTYIHSEAALTKFCRLVGLNKACISHSSEVWKSTIKVLADLVLVRAFLAC